MIVNTRNRINILKNIELTKNQEKNICVLMTLII